jgi:anti-sigma regulatory factor (Ser/Thr protein kinase)
MDRLQDRIEQDSIELDSRLEELVRVGPWIDALADRLGLHEGKRFAIHLCMEEALANIILHGYRSEPGHPIVITSFVAAGTLSITIDDLAPLFSPIEFLPHSSSSDADTPSLDSITPSGNGIRLLKHFAGSLGYERRLNGNRLTIAFPVPAEQSGP